MKKFNSLMFAALGALMLAPTAQAEDAAETWTSLGKGTFREVFTHPLYVFDYYPELDVEIEECDQTPGRYRLVNAYKNYPDMFGGAYMLEGNHYIVVDATNPEEVMIELSHTGYVIGQGQELVVSSVAYDMLNLRGASVAQVIEEKVFGKIQNGCITFPNGGLLTTLYDFEGDYTPEERDPANWMYQRCNTNNLFRIKLPGAPSLDVATSFIGIDNDRTTLSFSLQMAKDVEKVKLALVEGEADDAVIAKIDAGEIASQEVTKAGEVKFPYTKDGQFTLVALPYYDGKALDAVLLTKEYAYDESTWRKVGQAMFTEAVMSSNFMYSYASVGHPEVTYQVDVEESVSEPGYIRMVDPYGANYPYSSDNNYDNSKIWYIYINATDPDKVYMEYSEGIGHTLGYGRIDIWSYYQRAKLDENCMYYGMSDYDLKALNMVGKFGNDEITFPKNALCIRFPLMQASWYEANMNGKFSLKFEEGQLRGEQSGVESVVVDDDSDAPAEYYNLSGLRVVADQLTPGVYVVRQGKTVKKVLVK